MKKIVNKTRSKKGRGNPAWVKGGESPNPAGRPREGESWSGVLRWAANLTGEEAATIAPAELSKEFKKLGKTKLKEAVSLRVLAALLFEPSSGLFNAVMDRAEGKLVQPSANVPWKEWARQNNVDPDAVMRVAEQVVDELIGQDEPV